MMLRLWWRFSWQLVGFGVALDNDEPWLMAWALVLALYYHVKLANRECNPT